MESYMAKKNTTPTSNLSADKAKAVEAAIAQIEKNYGKGSIMALGSQPVEEIPVIPSGCIQLDMALGVGGFPRGRIIEIYGPESSGKTTLTLHAIAEAQKLGGVAAFIDAEHAFDAVYARKLGVDIESLLVSQPDTGEQALDIAETLVRSGAIDIIVIDSVAALVPQAEINGEMGQPRWPAGPTHESGPPQAHRHPLEVQHLHAVHQPAPHEDRRDVRQPRNHYRR